MCHTPVHANPVERWVETGDKVDQKLSAICGVLGVNLTPEQTELLKSLSASSTTDVPVTANAKTNAGDDHEPATLPSELTPAPAPCPPQQTTGLANIATEPAPPEQRPSEGPSLTSKTLSRNEADPLLNKCLNRADQEAQRRATNRWRKDDLLTCLGIQGSYTIIS